MPNRSTDALFQLVKSLEKSEKRNFKLYVKRNSSSEDLKIVKLFDALDKLNEYDEGQLLKKNKSIRKQQLSNMKAHLYKQILSSLRLIKDENNIDIQLHEQMDHARILFNRGLYLQSLKILDKMKEMARNNNQLTYLQQALPEETKNAQGFYERLYLYQSYCWYAFIRQDFLQYYRYTQKWVDLFSEYPNMYDMETAHYIKGMHNLMGAHFDLRNAKKLQESVEEFERFSHRKVVRKNDINHILVFVYLTTARINIHFLEGSFSEGLKQVPYIEEKLKEYELYIDRHRILVFYYKIACLYFGAEKNERAIEYLNKIINWKVDLRTDLQCYARLLHLIAHYELGNFDLLEYLTKSVYRFMAKMESLSAVEEEMFHFLRRSFRVNAHALRPEFENLLEKLKKYENNPLETRAFSYLDVISWLESKINNVPVQNVIRDKYLASRKKIKN